TPERRRANSSRRPRSWTFWFESCNQCQGTRSTTRRAVRDHNLLQAIARTNRPLPTMNKRTGLVVDYFGVFQSLEKALNFDENIREESLIDWDALKAYCPHCYHSTTMQSQREFGCFPYPGKTCDTIALPKPH